MGRGNERTEHPRNATSHAAIQDVAALAGVSVATVSRVLNGRPDVSAKTRETVLRHIRELGYVTNRSARALTRGQTGLIGLTVPHMRGDYFTEIIAGAAEALYERDARLVVCPTLHEHDRERSLLERLMRGTTDGALLIMPSESSAEMSALYQSGYPFVVIDPTVPMSADVPSVATANWSGGRVATEHLIALGHRHIGLITGPAHSTSSDDRIAGYHSALLAAGIPIDDALVDVGDFEIEGGFQAMQRLLGSRERPTAIFALNDQMAIGALRALRGAGLAVPGDVSIVGFDDIELSQVTTPSLTTVRQPLQEIGRVGADVLFRLINQQALDATRVELSTRLVIRDSTAPPCKR